MIELTGTIQQELNLKQDKNGNDYYYGWLNCNSGIQYVFFFFRPDYNLTMRLVELQVNQKLTLQGSWSKREPQAFLASNFYLEEVGNLGLFESNNFNE